MALFVFRKLILQTRMRSHPVALDVWFLVGPFVYFHTSCMRTAKAIRTVSPEPTLVAYVISTIISYAGSIVEANRALLSLKKDSEIVNGPKWTEDCAAMTQEEPSYVRIEAKNN